MKAAGREGGGGGVRLAASGEGKRRRRRKQALPTHAPQPWLKELTTRKRHKVQGEENEALDALENFFLFSSFFFFRDLGERIRSLGSISARSWEQGGQRLKKEPTRRKRETKRERARQIK